MTADDLIEAMLKDKKGIIRMSESNWTKLKELILKSLDEDEEKVKRMRTKFKAALDIVEDLRLSSK
ncbi:hypothetical protein LCGC14_0374310 [marine sediment metagenome]|uniref:Uncharacterized protein n=1 Tax=marine sediment metagenome TaxID=412755 RepID=A0A0F9VRD8_9ZZZZ